jgi:ABA4-like protein
VTLDPAALFQVMNLLPVPVWLCWMAAPRSRVSRTLARAVWPWVVLASAYLVFIVVAIASAGLDPRAFGSLGGVMHLFQSRWATLAGWTHYLCFDLFVARWIMNDAPDAGYWLTPILFLTLMFGPVGLLCYLAVRGPLGFDR